MRQFMNNSVQQISFISVKFPKRFEQLAQDQKQDVAAKLIYLSPKIQQAVLDEWDFRCSSGSISKPVGYLFGLLKKAGQNVFRPTL